MHWPSECKVQTSLVNYNKPQHHNSLTHYAGHTYNSTSRGEREEGGGGVRIMEQFYSLLDHIKNCIWLSTVQSANCKQAS